MTTTPRITTVAELNELDWELPILDVRFPVVNDEDFDAKILAYFEDFNGVELFDAAYQTFKATAVDYYTEG
ncbi:hypothetical protein [Microbacterium sp. p3-SID336]|uniref:hypothetical protein n=1 Tax=Microbacterium sp. p3-SID336 TaxID=2916212 RepID=UPI0021A3230B|nr:hypothetical protein [Microbacterium sp. p3-SID336]MCT1478701.1 hypothetical protein [Microbacterium sp. p3-SID336]